MTPDPFASPAPENPDSPAGTPPDEQRLPEELPPVEPPSAGFIVQLFVVPGLIVVAIVGVWALFGRLGSAEQDWRKLVAEVRNENPHRRWRGALGLAQMLKADQELGGRGEGLAENSEIARELTGLLRRQFGSRSEDDIRHQAFLVRTLGFLDVPEVVLPALEEAMRPGQDLDVRRNAIASAALVAGRAVEGGHTIDAPELVGQLIDITRHGGSPDEQPLRHLAAFALGLFPDDPMARQQLAVLAGPADPSDYTCVNAALGLARHGSAAGLPLFEKVVQRSAGAEPADEIDLLVLGNTLRAVDELADELTAAQRDEWAGRVQPLAREHRNARIRIDAEKLLLRLNETAVP